MCVMPTVAVHGSCLYMAGMLGEEHDGAGIDMRVYNFASNRWTCLSHTGGPSRRACAYLASDGHQLILFGGQFLMLIVTVTIDYTFQHMC